MCVCVYTEGKQQITNIKSNYLCRTHTHTQIVIMLDSLKITNHRFACQLVFVAGHTIDTADIVAGTHIDTETHTHTIAYLMFGGEQRGDEMR